MSRGSCTSVGAAALALALLLPSQARADGCEAAVNAASAALAQCRLHVESLFSGSSETAREDAALQQCADRFAAAFARAQMQYGATCPQTESASTFNAFMDQSTRNAAAAAAGAPLATFPDVCTAVAGETKVTFHNNCGVTENLTAVSGSAGQTNPSCLQGIANGGSATAYLPTGNNYGFWTGSYGQATLFEINVAGEDSFDVSYNQGFNIGITVISPPGTLVPYVIATDSTAPGAYQLQATQPACYTQPCLSPTYNATHGGSWDVYLCNRPGDVNTPGPCGCTICPCPVSAGGPGCNWQTVTCMGVPNPGVNGCPMSCPGT